MCDVWHLLETDCNHSRTATMTYNMKEYVCGAGRWRRCTREAPPVPLQATGCQEEARNSKNTFINDLEVELLAKAL